MAAEKVAGQAHPCHTVGDLSKDERYNGLEYVSGAPQYRFYLGMPLVTSRGFRIGMMSVLDTKPRSEATEYDIAFLSAIAGHVMQHMEMWRDSEQQKRYMTMSKGLAAFVEGRDCIPPEWKEGPGSENDDDSAANASGVKLTITPTRNTGDKRKNTGSTDEGSPRRPPHPTGQHPDRNEAGTGTGAKSQCEVEGLETNEDSRSTNVLNRAANLLRESLSVDYTAIFDADTSFAPYAEAESESRPGTSGENQVVDLEPLQRRDESSSSAAGAYVAQDGSKRPQLQAGRKSQAKLVSFSREKASAKIPEKIRPKTRFKNAFLKSLLRRYPTGKIWTFDSRGSMSSSEKDPMALESSSSEDSSSSDDDLSLSRHDRQEAQALMKAFPKARQILYASLWDHGESDYASACFAVSLKPVPVFTSEIEVAFVRAFVNSVGVVAGQAKLMMADKQKSDFISSISHEFRSPLHAILASTDLLSESSLDQNQTGLCQTIGSSGQILLDTINQILDYSKINKFRDHKKNSVQGSSPDQKETGGWNTRGDNVSALHKYASVNIAYICEEVVEAVTLGQRHSNSEAVNSSGGNSTGVTDSAQQKPSSNENASVQPGSDVVVIINVSPDDWVFECMPGALRRILMNLTGNSLKYTSSGSVKIDLYLRAVKSSSRKSEEANISRSVATLTVTDTGKGISEDYLRTKLYTPFSQESRLAQGSGLGLSMVKDLVKLLSGTIEINSQVGNGTRVEVNLPLQRVRNESTASPIADGKVELDLPEQTAASLRDRCRNKSFRLFISRGENLDMVQNSLRLYLTGWFSMREVHDSNETCDILFLDQVPENTTATSNSRNAILLRDAPLQGYSRAETSSDQINYVHLNQPFGPNKVSRALQACLASPSKQPKNQRNGEVPYHLKGSATFKDPEHEILHSHIPRREPTRSTSLPVNAAKPLELSRTQDRPLRALPPIPSSKTTHILIVDDNAVNLRVLRAYLEKLGYPRASITDAEDGQMAVEAVESAFAGEHGCAPQLIFMDLSMPVMDGFESTRRIREVERGRLDEAREGEGNDHKRRRSFIVALTGVASEQDQKDAFEAGVDHFVAKPLRFPQMKALLGEWGFTL